MLSELGSALCAGISLIGPMMSLVSFVCLTLLPLVLRSHFGSSRDPSTRLKFPLHLPSRQPHQDSFRVRFLFAVHIAWPLLLVALSSSVGNLVVMDLVRSLWWNVGIQLGRCQPRAGLVGRHSRDRMSLSQTSYLPKVRGEGKNRSRNSLPACHAAVETSLPRCP